MTSRTPQRAQLGAAAVLSVSEACALLPWADSKAREWLELRGLIITAKGVPHPCVVWGQVRWKPWGWAWCRRVGFWNSREVSDG